MKLEAYLLTVAVQAGIISLCCLLLALCIRQARWRAGFALIALLATALLPWAVLPLRSEPRKETPAAAASGAAPVASRDRALPSVTNPISLPGEAQAFVEEEPRAYPPAAYRPKPAQILLTLWAMGSLVGFGMVLLAAVRTGRWCRSMDKPDDEEWAAILSACPECGPRDRFRLGTGTISPALAGIFRPRIILPRFLLDPARSAELAWALRHELAHREGLDSRWAFATQIIRAGFWWNPAVHLLQRMWANAREQVCDRAAVSSPEERAAYGHFLISLAAKYPAAAVAMAAASKRRLGGRIRSLLDAPVGPLRPASWLQKTLAACFCLLALLVGTRFGFVPRAIAETAAADRSELEQILHPDKLMVASMAVVVSPGPFAEDGMLFDAAALAERIRLQKELLARAHPFPDVVVPPKISVVPGPVCTGPLHQNLWTNLSDYYFSSSTSPLAPWDEDCTAKSFNGWLAKHSYRAVGGDKFEVSLHAAYSFVPGHHPAPCYVLPGQPSPKMVELEKQAVLASGQALAFSMGEVEPGIHVSLVLGLTAVDPWELTVARETKYFPILEVDDRSNFRRVEVTMTRETVPNDFLPQGPSSAQRNELNVRLDLARDRHPANAELVVHRELQRKILAAKPGDLAASWKLNRLQNAIWRNAEKDPAVQALTAERDRLDEPERQALAERIKQRHQEMREKLIGSGREPFDLGTEPSPVKIKLYTDGDLEQQRRKREAEQWNYERRRHEW